jgi:type VI protein secretion system component Hcp
VATTDMLMMLVQGDQISAECKASIDTTDKFTSDFMEGKYFEISDFSFGIDLTDDDGATKETVKDKNGKEVKAPKVSKFARWKAGTAEAARAYEVNMDEFTFTRQIDVASPKLFLSCFRSKSFDSAVIVKRKVGGTKSLPFFRIDLSDVLLVSIDWEVDDAVVREKCKMVCREVGVKYRVQMPDGSKGAEIGTPLLSLAKRA